MASKKIFAEETVDMKNLVEDTFSSLGDMRDTVHAWRTTLMDEMKGVWEGDDYDRFRAETEGDFDRFDKADEDMRQLLSAVRTARLEYEQMESEIVSLNIARV